MNSTYEVLTKDEIRILKNSKKERSEFWEKISAFLLSKDEGMRIEITEGRRTNTFFIKKKYKDKLYVYTKREKNGKYYLYLIKK